jgi:hypothetical protein
VVAVANQQILKLKPVCSLHLQLLYNLTNPITSTPGFVNVNNSFLLYKSFILHGH